MSLSQRHADNDKHNAAEMIEDERRAFYDRVQATQEEILDALRTTVSTWTENCIEDGCSPDIAYFLLAYPEWDHENLYDVIESEIERVKGMIEKCSK